MNDFDKIFVLAFYNFFLKIELNCDEENMIILNGVRTIVPQGKLFPG